MHSFVPKEIASSHITTQVYIGLLFLQGRLYVEDAAYRYQSLL